MIDINLIRKDAKFVEDSLAKKGCKVNFSSFLNNDKKRIELEQKNDELKARRNSTSAEIAKAKKEGKNTDEIVKEMKELGNIIAKNDAEIKVISDENFNFLAGLPNMPDEDLLAGEKENNKVIKIFGEQPKFDFKPKNHVDLCEDLGIIDYKRGVKIAGNGNWIYSGIGAQLEWAVLNFFVSEHLKDGYKFMLLPHMLNYDCGFGAGQFPKFNDDVYWVVDENGETNKKFLLPTAETALVNLHSNEVLNENDLPIKYFGFTPCYRKEAGSYRSEERGMIRGHQFNKIEMVQYAKPEDSKKAFEELLNKATSLVEKLGLHFRVSKLAAGDCSASMARTYDIEVYIPSMGIYKEVSSVSNANDYQARRNNTKFRNETTKKNEFVHTLNGSGLATSRIIPAIVEQFQQADGSVKVPDVLIPFLGTNIIKRA